VSALFVAVLCGLVVAFVVAMVENLS